MSRNVLVRAIFFAAGSVCLAFATIGVFMPLLPTTPFLLLSAALYLRSSERMYNWLFENRYFGDYLKNYSSGRGIPLTTKILAVLILWIAISYSIVFISTHWAMSVLLIVIATAVSVHLFTIPTFRKGIEQKY